MNVHVARSLISKTSTNFREGRALVPDGLLSVLQLGLGWFEDQPGGLDRYYAGLLAHSAAAGIEFKGLVAGMANIAVRSNGRVSSFAGGDRSLLFRWHAVRSAVAASRKETPFDLWVSHFALYAYPVLRKHRDLPHVVHFHGPWADECRREGAGILSTRIKAALERRVYHSADRLIVLSKAFQNVLCETYRIPESRVRIIPGGVDCDRYHSHLSRRQAREQLGWPTDRPILLCIRRLVHRMGLHLLVGAVQQLIQKHPDVLCLIGGKGPLANELRQTIADAGLSEHVRLLGYVPDEDLPIAYRAADFSVVPSDAWEGFGLITIESLAAGTPVIVTPVGGLPEVIEPLAPQMITGAATVEALSETLDGFLSGAVVAPDDHACSGYARQHFDWSIIAASVAGVYREACER